MLSLLSIAEPKIDYLRFTELKIAYFRKTEHYREAFAKQSITELSIAKPIRHFFGKLTITESGIAELF